MNLSIGRGHPFYLDGIIEALNRAGHISLVRVTEDVFDVATGLSGLGWKAVQVMYRQGSSSGMIGRTYNRVRHRTDYNKVSLAQYILGVGLRKRYCRTSEALLVSHPILVALLRGKENLLYQHGELVTPDESLVQGASLILVPTQSCADVFRRFGYGAAHIFISGLCIETGLTRMARDAYAARLERVRGREPLTGAFYSSGAEPPMHVDKLVASALAATCLEQRVIIFAKKGGRVSREVSSVFQKQDIPLYRLDVNQLIPSQLPTVVLVEFGNRREETHLTARLFPWFDYFVAPSHERTNWAIGLGLPMFILEPAVGTYAPLNRQLLLDHEVGASITSMNYALSFGTRLESLRNKGILEKMARAGWGKYDIHGFENIARYLIETFGDRQV